MKFFLYPLGSMQANCYVVVENDKCIIIDPGDSADLLLEMIQRQNLEVVALIATHGHFDHIMAVGEIQLSLNVPLYLHPKDTFLLDRVTETARHFLGYEPAVIHPTIVEPLKTGKVMMDEFVFDVIPTPGHTPGSVSLYFKEDNIVITGDTLFQQAVGDYRHKYSSKEDLKKSLDTLFLLPEETIVYTGHGDETTIGFEKKYPVLE